VERNKSIVGASISVVTIFLTQIFLRAIGGTRFSVQISVTVLLLVSVLFSYGMISNKNKIFGLKLNIITSLLMLIMCIIISIEIIYNDCFPEIAKTHQLLTLTIYLSELISFIAFVTFIAVATSITKKNKNKD
jgi:fumarate reductase subunit D